MSCIYDRNSSFSSFRWVNSIGDQKPNGGWFFFLAVLFFPSPHAGFGTTASVLALSDSLAVSALALALDKGPMSGVPSVARNVTCCRRPVLEQPTIFAEGSW